MHYCVFTINIYISAAISAMDAGDDTKATTARAALNGSGAKLLNVYIYDKCINNVCYLDICILLNRVVRVVGGYKLHVS